MRPRGPREPTSPNEEGERVFGRIRDREGIQGGLSTKETEGWGTRGAQLSKERRPFGLLFGGMWRGLWVRLSR